MKALMIVFITTSICMSQESIWYAHATLGDNSNGGTGWGDAELTLAAQRGDGNTNDTLLVRGDFGSEDSNLFSGNNGSVVMDSSFYEAKAWKWLTTPSLMDTSILDWGTRIDRAVLVNGSNFEYWGIWFDGQDNVPPIFDTGSNTGGSAYFCRFNRPAGSVNRFIELEGVDNEIKFCLFDGDASLGIQTFTTTQNFTINHCTFNGDITIAIEANDPTTPSTTASLKNSIIRSTTSSLNNLISHDEPDETLNDINYNVWFATNPAKTDTAFLWDDTIFQNFSGWRDSLQTGTKGIDPDGESNSFYQNPALITGSNFGLIQNSSIAFEAASDGGEIGFYQFGDNGFNVRRRGIKR